MLSHEREAGLRGSFTPERHEYRLGEPIWITLAVSNAEDSDVFVFLPQGRANGVALRVEGGVEGEDYLIKGLESEPEAGLVGKSRLEPGGSISARYALTDWITFNEPGSYTVECSVEIEAATASLREPDREREDATAQISTSIPLTIEAPA